MPGHSCAGDEKCPRKKHDVKKVRLMEFVHTSLSRKIISQSITNPKENTNNVRGPVSLFRSSVQFYTTVASNGGALFKPDKQSRFIFHMPLHKPLRLESICHATPYRADPLLGGGARPGTGTDTTIHREMDDTLLTYFYTSHPAIPATEPHNTICSIASPQEVSTKRKDILGRSTFTRQPGTGWDHGKHAEKWHRSHIQTGQ
ncbi:hypothetical protein QR685DRAFT_602193 [Neurospora intermedia]|uniref:Uncharacterized protein n=1 Tax=Neurospora intermedia TaxID=5142 RepID=A0ABR3DQ45_NEUIN